MKAMLSRNQDILSWIAVLVAFEYTIRTDWDVPLLQTDLGALVWQLGQLMVTLSPSRESFQLASALSKLLLLQEDLSSMLENEHDPEYGTVAMDPKIEISFFQNQLYSMFHCCMITCQAIW